MQRSCDSSRDLLCLCMAVVYMSFGGITCFDSFCTRVDARICVLLCEDSKEMA